MPILNIVTDFAGQVGVLPRIVRIYTNDAYATVIAAGYLDSAADTGFTFLPTDIVAVNTTDNGSQFFNISTSNGVITLIPTEYAGEQTVTTTIASATAGIVSGFTSTVDLTNAAVTSGEVVGIDGVVEMVGANTATFAAGIRGSVTVTGTLNSGSDINAGKVALDFSGATVSGGTMNGFEVEVTAPATLNTYTGARMISGINTTEGTLNSQIYLKGAAVTLLELDDNNATAGASYVTTPAGATPSGALRALTVKINGTAYKILAAVTYS